MSRNRGKIFLPVDGYFDDFETSDPLGPHSNKLGAMYASVPCLPPKMQAKLQYIFLARLFRSEHRKTFGSTSVFREVINQINDLQQNGVTDSITRM